MVRQNPCTHSRWHPFYPKNIQGTTKYLFARTVRDFKDWKTESEFGYYERYKQAQPTLEIPEYLAFIYVFSFNKLWTR